MENQIEKRLFKLEKQVARRGKLNVILLGCILLTALYGFKRNQTLENLKVKSLSVMDEKGRTYLYLNGDSIYGGWMNFYNASGKRLVNINSSNSNGHLSLYDKYGTHIVWLTQMSGGGGYIGIKNSFGKDAGGIGTSGDGSGYFNLYDKNENARVMDGINSSGGYSSVYNSNGKLAVELSTGYKGYGGVTTYDYVGDKTGYLGSDDDGNGNVNLYNAASKQTVAIGGKYGYISLNDNNGNYRAWLGVYDKNNSGFLNLYNNYGRRILFAGSGDYDNKGYLYTSDGYNTTGYFPK